MEPFRQDPVSVDRRLLPDGRVQVEFSGEIAVFDTLEQADQAIHEYLAKHYPDGE
jgi:hypothetical protein